MGGGPKHEKLLCTIPVPEPKEAIESIRKKFPHIEIIYHDTSKHQDHWKNSAIIPPEDFHDVTILLTISTFPPQPSDAPNLKLIHVCSAGINHMTKHPIYTDSDIPITTSNGIHGPQIAEWVIMTALLQSHYYNPMYELQKQHKWDRANSDKKKVQDMVGQRLGVLGYGSIGRQVGRVAKALGMDVIAYTASPKDTPEKKRDNGFVVPGTGDLEGSVPSEWYSGLDKPSLHNFLKQDIDFLLISVPLTKETTHFIAKEELEILSKRKAFLANISRGDIVKQPDLVEALKNGSLRGAAVDVASPEPLPADDPLWDAPNVTITPHISGNSANYWERAVQVLEANLERRENGKELINLVDRKRGY